MRQEARRTDNDRRQWRPAVSPRSHDAHFAPFSSRLIAPGRILSPVVRITGSSDSDLIASILVGRRSGVVPQTRQISITVSRNEIGNDRKLVQHREVTDALAEKPHYKTQLDDRSGASIFVTGDQIKTVRASRPVRFGLLASREDCRRPIVCGQPRGAGR